jgi:GTP-binding protein Era
MNGAAHRAGRIAIIGRPNVGKSTLLNRLLGQKISVTSRKPQTTRKGITGILTLPGAQAVFVDTPGFQTEHLTALNRAMNRVVTQSLAGVDAALWVVEAGRYDERDAAVLGLLPPALPTLLAVNKIDRLKSKPALLPYIRAMSARRDFAAIVPVSARSGDGVERLVAALLPLLPQGAALYGEDEITTLSERELAAEIVREKLFRLLGDELPYRAAVEIERFATASGLRRIHAGILVDKPGQKAIVVGRNGEKLKAVGMQARLDMEKLFGGKVFLELWVKVRSGWADDERALKRMGYR